MPPKMRARPGLISALLEDSLASQASQCVLDARPFAAPLVTRGIRTIIIIIIIIRRLICVRYFVLEEFRQSTRIRPLALGVLARQVQNNVLELSKSCSANERLERVLLGLFAGYAAHGWWGVLGIERVGRQLLQLDRSSALCALALFCHVRLLTKCMRIRGWE